MTSPYPKPPYENYEEVFHKYPVTINAQNAFRAMERDGKMFKLITHKMKGIKYIYWHPDKNSIELWHKKNNVEAWAKTIHKLDERFVFVILRSKMYDSSTDKNGIEDNEDSVNTVDETSDTDECGDSEYDVVQTRESVEDVTQVLSEDTETNDMDVVDDDQIRSSNTEVQWALQNLEHFKNRVDIKELFDIPDLSGQSHSYILTPSLMDALDVVLKSSHLPTGQTVLYDRHTCSLVWLRRDNSSYEIRTQTQNAVDFAKRFILNTLFNIIVSGKIDPYHLAPNTPVWINAYHQWMYQNMVAKQQRIQRKHQKKTYQHRKHHKRQNVKNDTQEVSIFE